MCLQLSKRAWPAVLILMSPVFDVLTILGTWKSLLTLISLLWSMTILPFVVRAVSISSIVVVPPPIISVLLVLASEWTSRVVRLPCDLCE